MANPFETPTENVAPAEAPVAETAEAPEAPKKAPGGKGTSVKDGTRKAPNRQKTADDVKQILESYASKQTSEIANELGLTRMQVYKTVLDARKKLQQKADETDDPATKQKILEYIETHLPSKRNEFGGRKGSTLDSVLDDLF